MQTNRTTSGAGTTPTRAPAEAVLPQVSQAGTLLLAGFGPSLRIDHGALVVRLGARREARIGRVQRPRLRRLVVYGKGGWASFEVWPWLAAAGASWAILSRGGTVLGTGPAAISPDEARLRRSQALSAASPLGLRISADLVGRKLSARRGLVAERFPERDDVIAALEDCGAHLVKAKTIDAVRAIEAEGAAFYFSAWSGVAPGFARADEPHVPAHWRRPFTGRASALSGANRAATDPTNAMLNLGYALLEIEATIAMRGAGLDPAMPLGLHAYQKNRSSGALDLMEPARAMADRMVLTLLDRTVFPRRSFVEQPDGTVRIATNLVRAMLDAMPLLAEEVAPIAERVAAMLAEEAGLGPQPTRLTQDRRSEGRAGMRKGERRRRDNQRIAERALPTHCLSCGQTVERGRRFCDACLTSMQSEQRASFAASGPAALARLRREGRAPVQRSEVRAKIGRSQSERRALDLAWEVRHPEGADPAIFTAALSGLRGLPLRAIAEATRLSLRAASDIRAGKVPHPRHWAILAALAGQVRQ